MTILTPPTSATILISITRPPKEEIPTNALVRKPMLLPLFTPPNTTLGKISKSRAFSDKMAIGRHRSQRSRREPLQTTHC